MNNIIALNWHQILKYTIKNIKHYAILAHFEYKDYQLQTILKTKIKPQLYQEILNGNNLLLFENNTDALTTMNILSQEPFLNSALYAILFAPDGKVIKQNIST